LHNDAAMRVSRPVLAISLATFASATLAAACAAPVSLDPDEVEDGVAVPTGKEDDFYSLSAREYVLEGRATVTVEDGAGLARAKQLIGLKHVAIAWFLNQYLVDKEEEDANHAYGGFGAMVKTGSYDDLKITAEPDGRTYSFTFRQLVAGRENLLTKLPLDSHGVLSVEIGKPTNDEMARLDTNAEWYRQAPWSEWDPSKVSADQKETLALTVRPETASRDAWWDYARLLDDGKLTVDVHFGWDYHSNYHLKHSRAFYDWLVSTKGFTSPVSSFDEYTRTSGPLTKKITADGKPVTVEVRIFYGKPGSDTDPDTAAGGIVLENDVRASLKQSDVIVYSGHSGPFYGFALANWNKTDEGDLDDTDMASADMPPGKYQIIVAEGCDTYMIGEAFKQNPNKQGKNVDVITTTSFSNAATPATVEDFMTRLIETDSHGRHRPRTVSSLLEDLDSNSYWFHTMYGVHGIDDDPQLHPYARTDLMCHACSKNADCGGVGNACVRLSGAGAGKVCAPACTSDDACGDGYRCAKIASSSSSTIYASMCVPRQNRCQ
jgi:hypothetical protein